MPNTSTFVAGLELPAPPRRPMPEGVEPVEPAPVILHDGRAQSVVVASEIVSFVEGVTPQRRRDVVNASLLAQLVAKKRVPDSSDVYAWYNAYFDVLSNIGWVIQDVSFATYDRGGNSFETHAAILDVATVLLGPGTAALAIVTTTLEALRSVGDGGPWITLFNRESRNGRTARFQVTLVEQDADGQFLVSLMAFALEASTTVTQVLFFKVRSNTATLKHQSGRITINATVLSSIRDQIADKIRAFTREYVATLPDLV